MSLLFETRPALGERSAVRVVVICLLRLNPPIQRLALLCSQMMLSSPTSRSGCPFPPQILHVSPRQQPGLSFSHPQSPDHDEDGNQSQNRTDDSNTDLHHKEMRLDIFNNKYSIINKRLTPRPVALVPDIPVLRAASSCRVGMLGMYILEQPRSGQSRWHSSISE